MAEGVVRRWSRRIVHPRLSLTTSDAAATVREVETALRGRGFRTTTTGAGFRARRRPWFDWLASAAASSCVLVVQPVSATTVEVDVEACGNHPAPDRVAEALTRAVADLAAQAWRCVRASGRHSPDGSRAVRASLVSGPWNSDTSATAD